MGHQGDAVRDDVAGAKGEYVEKIYNFSGYAQCFLNIL